MKSRTESVPRRADVLPVSPALAAAVRELDARLVAELGLDFAYCLMGGGRVIAASNATDGVVPPVVKPDPPEGRVYRASEIAALPLNTVIRHPRHGLGVVSGGSVSLGEPPDRLVVFRSGSFWTSSDGPPWDEPIKVVSRPDVSESAARAARA